MPVCCLIVSPVAPQECRYKICHRFLGAGGYCALTFNTCFLAAGSAIVDRTAYGDEPEEADEAQRQGHEAIRRLRQLKTAPPPAAVVEQPAERTEDALAA